MAFCYTFWAISGAGRETVFYGMMLLFASIPLYAWIYWREKSQKIGAPKGELG